MFFLITVCFNNIYLKKILHKFQKVLNKGKTKKQSQVDKKKSMCEDSAAQLIKKRGKRNTSVLFSISYTGCLSIYHL